jgi:hypothetical protein
VNLKVALALTALSTGSLIALGSVANADVKIKCEPADEQEPGSFTFVCRMVGHEGQGQPPEETPPSEPYPSEPSQELPMEPVSPDQSLPSEPPSSSQELPGYPSEPGQQTAPEQPTY